MNGDVMKNLPMKKTKMRTYATRDTILKMLSDDEVGRVSAAEAAVNLDSGEEYLDLGHLERGVRKALGLVVPMADVLPRKAVLADTWAKILLQLAAPTAAPMADTDAPPSPTPFK